MKKATDIFAEEKAYLLDKKYIDMLNEEYDNKTKNHYHLHSFHERTVKTSCGCMILFMKVVGILHNRIDDCNIIGCKIENEKVEAPEHAYIQAYFIADDFHYRVASAFPATEKGFEQACHWFDNKRAMITDRIIGWFDMPKTVRERSAAGKESVISVTKSNTLSNLI